MLKTQLFKWHHLINVLNEKNSNMKNHRKKNLNLFVGEIGINEIMQKVQAQVAQVGGGKIQ